MGRKKKGLSYLVRLIQTLHPSERKNLKLYLRCFDPNFDDAHQVKTLQLLELLEDAGPDADEQSIVQQLYGRNDCGGFKFLRLRLLSKIHESLLLDVNTERRDAYSVRTRTVIDVRKKLLLCRMLWGRNLTDELDGLLSVVIRKATKYEFYEEWEEALLLRQQYLGMREGLPAFERIQSEIDAVRASLQATRRAKFIYTRQMLESAGTACQTDCTEELLGHLQTLEADRRRTGSATVTWYYYLMRLEYYQSGKDYTAGQRLCGKLLELLESSPAIYSKRRLGIIYGQMANNALFAGQNEEAIMYAREAMRQFPNGSINRSVGLELEFYAHFYNGTYGKALEVLRPLVRTTGKAQTEQQFQRRNYLYANALFQLGRYADASRHLRNTGRKMLADKEGWNIGIRLLTIMLMIERGQYDDLEHTVDALRKHINRLSQRGILRGRYKLILRLLNRLIRYGFDYSAVARKCAADLALLAGTDPIYCWGVRQPEMIPFHQWFSRKVKTQYAVNG